MNDQEWLKVAMEDDFVVVDLLLRLNRAHSPPPMADSFALPLPLNWTVRQRRSKPILRQVEPRNKSESARASPTTPLSWSGATSASGGAIDGFEEFSRPVKSLDGARSEIEVKNAVSRTAKRSRKKKTLPELKEEESLLLKERNHLETALTSLRLTVENERARNKTLKKMTVDLQAKSMYDSTPTIPANVCCNDLNVLHSDLSLSNAQDVGAGSSTITLPDLNLPFNENSRLENFYREQHTAFNPRAKIISISFCHRCFTMQTQPNTLTSQNLMKYDQRKWG